MKHTFYEASYIAYLRNTLKLNNAGPATFRAWMTFWRILLSLKLTSKVYYY